MILSSVYDEDPVRFVMRWLCVEPVVIRYDDGVVLVIGIGIGAATRQHSLSKLFFQKMSVTHSV